jgi:hypothetical protein
VRHPVQARVRRQRVGPLEQLRRAARLGAVQTHADDQVAVRQQLRNERLGLGRVPVPQETGDDAGGEPVPLLRGRERLPESVQDHLERHAPARVGLRIDEDLRVPHALRGGARDVGARQVGEVLRRLQDGAHLVVHVEEGP